MSREIILALMAQLPWFVLLLSLPVLLAAALTGLLIGVLQALTQLQDQSFQFLCKLLVVIVVLVSCREWIGSSLLAYAERHFDAIGSMR